MKDMSMSKKEAIKFLSSKLVWYNNTSESTSSAYVRYQKYLYDYYRLGNFKNKKKIDLFLKDMEFVFRFIKFQTELFNHGIVFMPSVYQGQDSHNDKGNNYLNFVTEVNKYINDAVEEKYKDF